MQSQQILTATPGKYSIKPLKCNSCHLMSKFKSVLYKLYYQEMDPSGVKFQEVETLTMQRRLNQVSLRWQHQACQHLLLKASHLFPLLNKPIRAEEILESAASFSIVNQVANQLKKIVSINNRIKTIFHSFQISDIAFLVSLNLAGETLHAIFHSLTLFKG